MYGKQRVRLASFERRAALCVTDVTVEGERRKRCGGADSRAPRLSHGLEMSEMKARTEKRPLVTPFDDFISRSSVYDHVLPPPTPTSSLPSLQITFPLSMYGFGA